jgi:hypothetical protein
MRTAIYVHEPSTVTIRAKEPGPADAKIQLCRYNQTASQMAIGTHKLEPGIYLILSSGELEVNVRSVEVEVMRNDKDIWPDPKASVVALESGACAESVKEFFTLAKDLDVHD